MKQAEIRLRGAFPHHLGKHRREKPNASPALEQNETLFLNLSNPNPFGVIIADAQAVGTIFSDDCLTTPTGIRNAY